MLHLFVPSLTGAGFNDAAIGEFAPKKNEPYFLQAGHSGFSAPGFEDRITGFNSSLLLLMSFAGFEMIEATARDAIDRKLPFCILCDAVADAAPSLAEEKQRLCDIEAFAQLNGCAVHLSDVVRPHSSWTGSA